MVKKTSQKNDNSKKMKYYYEEVYKVPIYYIYNCKQEYAKKLVMDLIGGEMVEIAWGSAHAWAYTNNKTHNTIYGLWMEDYKDKECLAHEIFHLVGYIFADRGIKYEQENDEPFAYLIEHLFKKLK